MKDKMDSVCNKTIKHISGVKWQTSNWSVQLTSGIFDFTFRARKMKFKYVIKNLFLKTRVDNGWVRILEAISIEERRSMLEESCHFDERL